MVLRGCLENALYALYIYDDPKLPDTVERAETFLRRHDGEEWTRKVKQEFRPSAMLQLLERKDARFGKTTRDMYEAAIDNGAHPNARALLTNLDMQDVQGGFTVTTEYLNPDPVVRGFCWKCTAVVGVCSLDIFGLIWHDRFQSLGITEKLESIRQQIDADPQLWKTLTNDST